MIGYLATVLGITLAAFVTGRSWARRRQNSDGKMSPVLAMTVIAAALGWFAAARLARNYADTDGWGADAAGWFAHAGKWLILLGAMSFGHSWICGAKQIPAGRARRIFYFAAVLGMTTLILSRTVPVYFLLGNGQRDAHGFVRQSERLEVTCGAVALLNYLERYRQHPPLTERKVARVCGVTMEGTTAAALVRAARQFGLHDTSARVLTIAELEKSPLPAIVSISTLPTVHHATLLIRLDAERADFIDPAYGHWSIARQRFQEIWYGRTVLLK